MSKLSKYATVALLALLLTSTTVMMAVNAQEEPLPGEEEETLDTAPPLPPPPNGYSSVIMLSSSGGTTSPRPGSYDYRNGSTLTFIATPFKGFTFKYWVIQGGSVSGANVPVVFLPDNVTDPTDIRVSMPPAANYAAPYYYSVSANPLYMLCGYGYTYQIQAVFAPTALTTTSESVVVILRAIGGKTNMAAGTYSYSTDKTITLTATPNEGFTFQYWVISGNLNGHGVPGQPGWDSDTLTDNPIETHTPQNYTYAYQPLFTPTSSNVSQGIPAETFYIVVAALAIIAVIAVAVAVYMRSKQVKK